MNETRTLAAAPGPALGMQWASVSSTAPTLDEAVSEAADRLTRALGGRDPDLVLVFASPHHLPQFAALPTLLRQDFQRAVLLGTLGDGVIGGGTEYEDLPALSLIGACLPEVKLHAIHLTETEIPPLYAERSLWTSALRLQGDPPDCMLLLSEPFGFDTESFVAGLDRHYPSITKLGGVAAGVEQAGPPCLLLNDTVHTTGVLCLALTGNIAIDTIVAQGCRPVGEPMFANSTHENLVIELDGHPAREVLSDLHAKLQRQDRQLFSSDALFIGIAMQTREAYRPGDFLIRSIIGLDPQSGALWINTPVAPNSVVQMHLRDPQTSANELNLMLQGYQASSHVVDAKACLLFACMARGIGFYGHPDHDSNAFRQYMGDLPIAGFFCNGEIGPVQGHTFLHSYTSVFGIVRHKHPVGMS